MAETGIWLRFVLAAFATWRITHLLASEGGPGDIVVRLRARLGRSFAGRLMDCFYCLSMWVAAPLAFFVERSAMEIAVVWLALSGAACLMERGTQQPISIQPISEFRDREEEGDSHNVLRSKPSSRDPRDGETGDFSKAGDSEDRLYSAARATRP